MLASIHPPLPQTSCQLSHFCSRGSYVQALWDRRPHLIDLGSRLRGCSNFHDSTSKSRPQIYLFFLS
ncbi:hypothetical protein CDL12_13663 [Handroanthus impetiginosus]|uniref:Uncharacterized protein n=1 Tax=Handroanthus impetiginosus TaxID=429701 RepID=A0A2G9H899_9LAMI|nr:hypothetical protein CDL12_13663 [Handroanthus impetiginosus]